MLIGGILMLAWHLLASLSMLGFLLPMVIACMGAIFLVGSCVAVALEPFSSMTGTAAAAFGCLEFGLSSLIGVLLMQFPVDSTVPYGICIVMMGLCSTFLFMSRQKATEVAPLNEG
jgi:hypothetical protein